MNRLFLRSVMAMAVMVMLSGCGTMYMNGKIDVNDIGDDAITHTLSTTADVRNTYFLRGLYCAEPSPDIAFNITDSKTGQISVQLPKSPVSLTLSDNTTAAVVQLAGRNALNVLARDLLYRSCEIMVNSINAARSDNEVVRTKIEAIVKEARKSYEDVVQLTGSLYAIEMKKAQAELLRAGGNRDYNSECIEAWLKEGELNKVDGKNANIANLKSWLEKYAGNAFVATFLNDSNYAGHRIQAIKTLGINNCN
ncbi:MAG: hypothetical protein SFH39_06910 [Candidatus Magnetobacterium sp. LHC-1]